MYSSEDSELKHRFLFSLVVTILLGIGSVWLLVNANRWLVEPGYPIPDSSSPVETSPSPTYQQWTAIPVSTPTTRVSIGPYVSQLAPAFSLDTLAGKSAKLEDYRGNVVLLNFWASWCIPCKEEMPLIQAAYEKHRDHGLVVLGINMTNLDKRSAIETFTQDTGVTFPIVLDEDGSVSETYRIISIPTSFFLDRSGIIRHFQLGAMTTKQIEQYMDEMLK
jgi:peroxiredoxin